MERMELPTGGPPAGVLLEMYRRMVAIRRFDETTVELRVGGKVFGTVHPYIGEEAVAVGVCFALELADQVVSTHRGHGHAIAKGASIERMMAELFGRRDGYCKGKGGSMHLADYSIGMLGANGIVAAGVPIAVGAALGNRLRQSRQVAIAFFGDGASGQGVFYESLNIAALWQLPVIFVCENNHYSSDNRIEEMLAAEDIASIATAFGIRAVKVDGNDVVSVHENARHAIAEARSGAGPRLLECRTYRWTIHSLRHLLTPDPRPREELVAAREADPIRRLEDRLRGEGIASENDLQRIRELVDEDIEAAVRFAEASPLPDPREALEDLFPVVT